MRRPVAVADAQKTLGHCGDSAPQATLRRVGLKDLVPATVERLPRVLGGDTYREAIERAIYRPAATFGEWRRLQSTFRHLLRARGNRERLRAIALAGETSAPLSDLYVNTKQRRRLLAEGPRKGLLLAHRLSRLTHLIDLAAELPRVGDLTVVRRFGRRLRDNQKIRPTRELLRKAFPADGLLAREPGALFEVNDDIAPGDEHAKAVFEALAVVAESAAERSGASC
jgi:hypothetical protein